VRTYGNYVHVPAADSPVGRSLLVVKAEPHVMVKAKRAFPRVLQQRTGALVIADTLEMCRDLDWFVDRYPLTADEATTLHVKKRAEEHRVKAEQVLDILAGYAPTHDEWITPALQPRPYQEIAANVIHPTGRLLLADDLGLGKTFSGALTLCDPSALPAVVVTETHLPRQWQRELARFFPGLTSHIVTSGQPADPMKIMVGRGRKRRPLYDQPPDILILTWSKVAGWGDFLHGKCNTWILDEAQALRHHDTARYAGVARGIDGARYRVGLTATPVYNYGAEIYNLIAIIAPDLLGDRSEFLREWCDDSGKVRDPRALGAYLRDEGIMLRRTAAEVGRELPGLIRVEQNVDSDPKVLQEMMGDAVGMARLILDTEGRSSTHLQRFQASGELEMRLRQATGVAKAPFVAAFIRLLLETEQKVVVWCWHREVYKILNQHLAEFWPAMYTGSESAGEKERGARRFMDPESQCRVMFMSLRSGAGLDGLQFGCHVGVFAELDWSPKVHHQAEGRLARDGQEHKVLAYYMVSEQGADPAMMEVLEAKLQQSEPIVDPDQDVFEVVGVDDVNRSVLLAESVLRRYGVDVPVSAGAH
jgi:SNF2 family DNA or RNA helicase